LTIPLIVEGSHDRPHPQPITAGIPFPRGALAPADSLVLTDPAGQTLDLQTQPLAHWPDGSLKWLLLDFLLPAGRDGLSELLLCRREPPEPRSRLAIDESPQGLVIDAGAAVFHLGRTHPLPIRQVVIGGREVLGGPAQIDLLDRGGKGKRLRRCETAVETRGPVRVTLRSECIVSGRARLRIVGRCCFFAGTGLVRLRLTLHNPGSAWHPGGMWDLGDDASVFFYLGLGWQLTAPGGDVCWTVEPGRPAQSLDGELEIYQGSSGGESWQGVNHVNDRGQVPITLRGYRVRVGGREETGLRANPVIALRTRDATLTAALPEFWQQFPKAVGANGVSLSLGLFPPDIDEIFKFFELQGGEQKTHTVWLHFGPPDTSPILPLAWVHEPARVRAAPEWYAASGAVPFLTPADPQEDGPLASVLAEAIAGPNSFFAKREVIDEYGWRHYGEVYADHEAAYYPGPKPVVSHYNNQYDVVYGMIFQYLRSGDARWLDLFDPLARHVIDIDIYHTDRDKAAYSGGLFWHTDHYRTAATCTHRSYSKSNRPPGASYGGGPGNEHNYTTGLMYYHYLTGDSDARDAVIGLADWVIRMDDGRLTVLGLLDPGPTGLASSTYSPDYHGPGRGAGNSVNALLDGWLLTGSRAYLDKAEELIHRVIHPADTIAARDLLNIEARWSYTVFLSALDRYLALKAETGELDTAYAYARTSLLHYAAWMVDNERPYFDRREQLQYPTETWAVQELRKANVMRLAARHADEPLRARLLERGNDFSRRAWADFEGFATRTVTRAVALLMIEGPRDAFLRERPPESAPRPAATYDFGEPSAFVPQKQRVKALLKSPRGLLGAFLRALVPRNWRER